MPRWMFSVEEVEIALTEVAMNGGYFQTAEKTLRANKEALGLKRIPDRRQISEWVNHTQRERYEQIRAELAPKIRAEIAEQNIALAARYAQAEHVTLDHVLEAVDNGDLPAKELVNLNRNLATAKGIAVDKYDRVSDPGPGIQAARGLTEIMNGLAALGLMRRPETPYDHEGEVTEETPPELEG